MELSTQSPESGVLELRNADRDRSEMPLQKSRGDWFLLLLIVVASFAVRLLAWWHWGTGTIESEGAEYAKIAENLRNGAGFVGLVSSGPEVLFNPLFPFLIAGVSFITHNYELAGRVIALVMGSLLPLPVFGIASRLFSRRVGFIAASLTLFHPLLVYLSFMVYSEGPCATIFLFGIYLVVRSFSDPSAKLWVLIGAAFGLGYLLRTEALAAFGISLLFFWFAGKGDRKFKYGRTALAVLVFLAFALPEVVFLYRATGKVMLEGKSRILFSYTGKRILAAEKHPEVAYDSVGGYDVPSSAPNVDGGYPEDWEGKWAFYGIDSHLGETGTAMRPWVDTLRETKTNFKDTLRLVVRGIRRNVPTLNVRFASTWLGAPLLPALALLGAMRRPWRGKRKLARWFVLLIMAAPAMSTFLVLWGDPRYYFIFVPMLCIWAANGLAEIGLWLKVSADESAWRRVAGPMAQMIVPGFVGLVMIIGTVNPVRKLYEFSDSARPYLVDREVGSWIGRQQDHPIRIMDLSLPLSYHAGAQQHVYFPYCDGDLAVHYLDTARVDYVVLRRGEKFTKYYEEWLTRGIPDHRAELLENPAFSGAGKFVIYRWHWQDGGDIPRS